MCFKLLWIQMCFEKKICTVGKTRIIHSLQRRLTKEGMTCLCTHISCNVKPLTMKKKRERESMKCSAGKLLVWQSCGCYFEPPPKHYCRPSTPPHGISTVSSEKVHHFYTRNSIYIFSQTLFNHY